MVKELKLFESSRRFFGQMNIAKAYYDEKMTEEERIADLLARRELLGQFYGFDGKSPLLFK